MGTVHVVVGGQAGSEAKGHVVAALTDAIQVRHIPHVVRVAGPNAGHTVYDRKGRKWPFQQIPCAAVIDDSAELYIGPGSEIDQAILRREVIELEEAGYKVRDRLHIDPQASILEPRHSHIEGGLEPGGMHERIGSTGKGVGACRADRIMRKGKLFADASPSYRDSVCRHVHNVGASLQTLAEMPSQHVIVEGTQGYDLGLHRGYYPYCTSSDCRAIDFLAMAGIAAPWAEGVDQVKPWVVMRTYPIRVAGNSGPMHLEITWEELANRTGGYVKPEFTTVTKKMRRVGEFDYRSARAAVRENGGSRCTVALMFLDYWFPEVAGCTEWRDMPDEAIQAVYDLEAMLSEDGETFPAVGLVGTGPRTSCWRPGHQP